MCTVWTVEWKCTGHDVTISTITVTLLTCGSDAVVIVRMAMKMMRKIKMKMRIMTVKVFSNDNFYINPGET